MVRALFDLCVRHFIRFGAWLVVRRVMTVRVEGLEHVPRDEPVLFAARHFHHLYDGALLLVVVPRPVHIIVALDWVRGRPLRLVMEFICGVARWPVVLRGDGLSGGRSAYDVTERGGYMRRALRDTTRLLREDHTVVIFPEGYPNVDPGYSPKAAHGDDAFLPFQPGFIHLAELAQRDRRTPVAIIPTGLVYRRLDNDSRGRTWAVTLRFGAPIYVTSRTDRDRILRAVEDQVRALSGLAM